MVGYISLKTLTKTPDRGMTLTVTTMILIICKSQGLTAPFMTVPFMTVPFLGMQGEELLCPEFWETHYNNLTELN